MLELREAQIDALTEVLYRILRGEQPSPIVLPPDYPQNEYMQLVSYINRFLNEYNEFAEFMYSLSRVENWTICRPRGKCAYCNLLKACRPVCGI